MHLLSFTRHMSRSNPEAVLTAEYPVEICVIKDVFVRMYIRVCMFSQQTHTTYSGQKL